LRLGPIIARLTAAPRLSCGLQPPCIFSMPESGGYRAPRAAILDSVRGQILCQGNVNHSARCVALPQVWQSTHCPMRKRRALTNDVAPSDTPLAHTGPAPGATDKFCESQTHRLSRCHAATQRNGPRAELVWASAGPCRTPGVGRLLCERRRSRLSSIRQLRVLHPGPMNGLIAHVSVLP